MINEGLFIDRANPARLHLVEDRTDTVLCYYWRYVERIDAKHIYSEDGFIPVYMADDFEKGNLYDKTNRPLPFAQIAA